MFSYKRCAFLCLLPNPENARKSKVNLPYDTTFRDLLVYLKNDLRSSIPSIRSLIRYISYT